MTLCSRRLILFLFGVFKLNVVLEAQSSHEIGPAGGTFEVAVDAGDALTATIDATWVMVSPNLGQGRIVVSINVEKNMDEDPREASVVFNDSTLLAACRT